MLKTAFKLLVSASIFAAAPHVANAQSTDPHDPAYKDPHELAPAPAPPRKSGEGSGPYSRLVIRGATVIDGTGGPPQGPMDIVVENNIITKMVNVGPPNATIMPSKRPPQGDKEIDATGMYLLPGFVDTHVHYGDAAKNPEAEYVNKLWLAHGVTAVRGVGLGPLTWSLRERDRSARNEITAPRLFHYQVLFTGDSWSSPDVPTAAKAREWVRFVKAKGVDGVKFLGGDPDIIGAALDEIDKVGLGSVGHLAPVYQARMTGRDAVGLGLHTITHSYGLFESLYKDSSVQDFPTNYNYFDEQQRWVALSNNWNKIYPRGSDQWNDFLMFLKEHKAVMNPTLNIISGTRDIQRVYSFEWHDKYTLPSLMDFYQPSRYNHASQWYYWTSEYENTFKKYFTTWEQMIFDYNKIGGHVTAGSDAGYHYQTYGFAYIDELQMLREAGLTPLEVIRSATLYGAQEIYDNKGVEPPFGVVRAGKLADLVLTDQNPLENLKALYGTGWMKLNDATGNVERVGGIKYVIKDGIIYDPNSLMADVAAMVQKQKDQRKGQTVIRQGLPVTY